MKNQPNSYVDNPFQSPAVLSYCTGFRGLERGIERAVGAIRTVAYVEIEAFIIENLLAGMEAGILAPAPIWANIKTFDARPFRDRVHWIIGGYPCQPFSNAGNRKGAEDPRHLWPYLERDIEAIRPVGCFFENVEGHLSLGFEEVYRSLGNLGYAVEAGIFTAEEVGAPHQRERLFILAIRKDFLGDTNNRRGEQYNQAIRGVPFSYETSEQLGYSKGNNQQRNGDKSRQSQGEVRRYGVIEMANTDIHRSRRQCEGRFQSKIEPSYSVLGDTTSCGKRELPEREPGQERCKQRDSDDIDGDGKKLGNTENKLYEGCAEWTARPSDNDKELADTDNSRGWKDSEPTGIGTNMPEQSSRDTGCANIFKKNDAAGVDLVDACGQGLEGCEQYGAPLSVGRQQESCGSISESGSINCWPSRPGEQQSSWEASRTIAFANRLPKAIRRLWHKNRKAFTKMVGEEEWYKVNRHLQANSEPRLGCTINGYNYREDLLRAYGNGVVEQTAELAFIELCNKLLAG